MADTDIPVDIPAISVSYAVLFLDMMEERGIARDAITTASKIDPGFLENPDNRLSPRQFKKMLDTGGELADISDLGFALGLRIKPTSHGFLGYAVMTCRTIREGIMLAERYFCLRSSLTRLQLKEENGEAVIEIEPWEKLVRYRVPAIEIMFSIISNVGFFLIGDIRKDAEIWLDYPKPDHYEKWKHELPDMVFGKPKNLMRFPAHYLDLPISLYDPHSSQAAVAILESELLVVDTSVKMDQRVRAVLMNSKQNMPSLEEVAKKMAVSTSTIKRRLKQQSTTFQKLVDDTQRVRAQKYLIHSGMSIAQISQNLGYTSSANFVRAFKKWTGIPPQAWREKYQD